MVKFTPELKQSFLDMLDNHKTENDIQRFLEEHTEMIPLPFIEYHGLTGNSIISKFRLGNELVTDFAYLSGCSDYWNFVLVEIEDSRKKLFTENRKQVHFTAEFNNAYDQITSWKAYVDSNRERVLHQIEKLRCEEPNRPVRFKYVLIIGRRADKEHSEYRAKMFTQKNTDDTRVLTYDSIITYCENRGTLHQKFILSPEGDQRFKIKSVPEDAITLPFGWGSSEYIIIEQSQIDQLKQHEHDIEEF